MKHTSCFFYYLAGKAKPVTLEPNTVIAYLFGQRDSTTCEIEYSNVSLFRISALVGSIYFIKSEISFDNLV